MSGGGDTVDEFGEIARLFRPLTRGAPEALGLVDDAAVLAPRPGEELVVTTDTIVAGVHFLPDTPPALVARKLLRVNLSDLAAKAAEPWGWFLNVAWPADWDLAAREAFAAGLAEEQARYGLSLFGGDTVRTPGPFTATALLIGRAPTGRTVQRRGARAGDVLIVSGTIGDAGLGLAALSGEALGLREAETAALVARHQTPQPRLALREALHAHAHAAADVSDGLLADTGRIADASGLGGVVELDALPLSPSAAAWVAAAPDPLAGRLRLATAGDDYEVVCALAPQAAGAFAGQAAAAGVRVHIIGRFEAGQGVRATWRGQPVALGALGWTHR